MTRKPILSEISRRNKFALLKKYLSAKSNVLEVGTGDGWFANNIRSLGHKLVTIDLEEPADIVGDIRDWKQLQLEKDSFDAIIALEVIEHVDCLNILRTLCKTNGLILLSSPHPRWDWVMKILENVHLTQKRTSAHCNLTYFSEIPLQRVVFKRPLGIHQVALFRNIEKPL